MATQEAPIRRSSQKAAPIIAVPARTQIQIIENPIVAQDPHLGRAVEEEIHQVLASQDLGPVEVRFRVCRDEPEGMKFICKVENPLAVPGEGRAPAWRWWSPLLETAEEFRQALEEGLEVRQQRLASSF
jgi:hypothetical protein